jgi:hypothetical protein
MALCLCLPTGPGKPAAGADAADARPATGALSNSRIIYITDNCG